MTNTSPNILAPLSPEQFEILCDPRRDPARRMPQFPSNTAPTPTSIPSVAAIEAALKAHVEGKDSPEDLIRALLHPFADGRRIALEPGKGLKRPTYAIHIHDIGLHMGRASVGDIAAELHADATALAGFAIGERAGDGAKSFILIAPGFTPWNNNPIRAHNPQDIKHAYRCLLPSSCHTLVDLDTTPAELAQHVRAARQIVHTHMTGFSQDRAQAEALIEAVHALRAAATVCVRTLAQDRSYLRFHLTIHPRARTISVQAKNAFEETNHAKLAFQAQTQAIAPALLEVVDAHPVLRGLPDTVEFQINGEPHYLHTTMCYTDRHIYDPLRSHCTFEHQDINELITVLRGKEEPSEHDDLDWLLHIDGHIRSKTNHELSATTLAQAFANAVIKDERRMSTLTDLLIDLASGDNGCPPAVRLFRKA